MGASTNNVSFIKELVDLDISIILSKTSVFTFDLQ